MAASRKIRSVPFFTQSPANTDPTSTGLDLAGMFSLLQADITCPRGQSFDRPLFEIQTLQSARSLAFAQPRRTRSYLATRTAFRHRPLAASCETQCLIGGHGYLEAVKCRRSK